MARRIARLRGAGMCALVTLWAGQMTAITFGQLDSADPWPKFGHDARNTCRYIPPSGADASVGRGPHSTPQLRWWAELGEADSTFHRGGAVVFKSGTAGTRYVAVLSPFGSYSGILRVFRFHPCGSSYDPSAGPATPVAERTFTGTSGDERIGRSTPLVLSNDVIVVNLSAYTLSSPNGAVWAGDVSSLSCPSGSPATISYAWSTNGRTDIDVVGHGSPATARTTSSGSWQVVLQSRDRLYALNPSNGNTLWNSAALSGASGIVDDSTPAVGQDDSGNIQIYVTTQGYNDTTKKHFHALPSNGSGWSQGALWSAFINRRMLNPLPCNGSQISGRLAIGTLASPGVPDSLAGPFVGSDEGALYAFDNPTSYNSGTNNERWPDASCNSTPPYYGDPADTRRYISATAGLSANGDIILWNENNALIHVVDSGTSFSRTSDVDLQVSSAMVFGAPALDTFSRVFIATPGSGTGNNDTSVLAYSYSNSGVNSTYIWRYLAPTSIGPNNTNIRRESRSPLAMDEDGTLYVVNAGYLLALRPLLGDLDGSGDLDCDDIDAFVSALAFPSTWESNVGSALGVNRVGVGDCNNDGLLNNFDIDCMEALLCSHCSSCSYCPPCEGDAPAGQSPFDYLRELFGNP
jgi:hypothetical protein